MNFDSWTQNKHSILFPLKPTEHGDVAKVEPQFVVDGGTKIPIKLRSPEVEKFKINWENDESYGININKLLDSIQWPSTSTKSSSLSLESTKQDSNLDQTKIEEQLKKNKEIPLNELLVEKYRPKNFLDLVGNEKTNRRILFWLRQWSPLVFNEQLPQPPSYYKSKYGLNSIAGTNPDDDDNVDILQRPKKKILLIHGPPGIGKTSVAHVVARQAGYSIAEINASDERAGPNVKQKILNTLFNKSLLDKPICLIADEIDGSVESGFVKVLIDIIHRDQRATNQLKYSSSNNINNNKLNKKGKKDKKLSHILTRPIITICNNLYAPSLEKLRPYCEIINMKKPIDSAIQEKIISICQFEKIDMDIKQINNLIDIAQGDIRNCINNLQFLSKEDDLSKPIVDTKSTSTDNNKMGSNSNENIKKTKAIRKDTSILWFKLVNDIFKRDPHIELRKQFYEILDKVESSGNFDRIVQGCFSLYPQVKYSDNGLSKPSELADWLYFHDLMNKSIYEQNGELNRYTSITPLTFFQKFSDIANREDLRIKNMEFEKFETIKFNMDMIKSMISKISQFNPKLAKILDTKSLIFEILPYLNQMFSTDLLRVKDIKLKNELIKKLLSLIKEFQLNLTEMENELSNTSAKVLSINLPFDQVVVLDDRKLKDIAIRRPHNLNLLSIKSEEFNVKKRHFNKILQDKATLEENKKAKIASNSLDFFKNQYDSINKSQQPVDENLIDNNNKIKNSKANSLNNSFFNTKSSRNSTPDAASTSKEHLRIWVKYKAGFSDAVRKNINWNNLWE